MSSVKKVFRKALKVVAIAAVVWFTAGTAANMMGPMQMGMGEAMAASANTMWTTTASVFTGAGAAPGAVGLEGAATTGALAPSAPIVGTELSGVAGLDIGATSLAGDMAAAEAAAAGTAGIDIGATTIAGELAAENVVGSGFTGWMAANPVPATVLGTGLLGAATAAMGDDETVDSRDYGTGGYDRSGEYQGKPRSGIVASQQKQDVQRSDSSRVAAPIVAGQMNQAVQSQPQAKRPVQRKNLPQLQKQGLVAQQQQQAV